MTFMTSDFLPLDLRLVWMEGEEGRVDESREKLIESRLILSQIYSTLLPLPLPLSQSKQTIRIQFMSPSFFFFFPIYVSFVSQEIMSWTTLTINLKRMHNWLPDN